MEFLRLLTWALGGALIASLVALFPALHVYNVAALLLLAAGDEAPVAAEPLAFLFLGMTAGYAITNVLPSVFLAAPDESTLFVVLPGQKYLLQRRGYEAVVLSGLGGLAGLGALVALAPLAPRILPPVREILRPHLGWMLWAVIAYLFLSEWPKGTDRAPAGWRRWWEGWRSLFAGLLTFLLSGLLGLILRYRSVAPVHLAYQNLMPAFVGLFAVPWVLQNLLAEVEVPPQHLAGSVDAPLPVVGFGALAGLLGGTFAAFFPVVTAGIGGLLAGQATAQRDDRAFIISQGAAKVLYYVGGLLFLFVPGLHLTRGGMAWMVSTFYAPHTPQRYLWATGAALAAGVLAFFLTLALGRLFGALVGRVSYRRVSEGTLVLLFLMVLVVTRWMGLLVTLVATGIGLLPVLWGSRRTNALGLLLLPLALELVGLGDELARLLGLL
jgi:putative membrane protein